MPSITLTLPSSGTVITAGLHSNNYTTLQTLLNGGLDSSNWAAGKIFDPAKLTQNSAVDRQLLAWDSASSTWKPSGLSYRKVSTKDIVNTVAETDLLNGEITIGAGLMGTDRFVRATLIGDYFNNTGAPQNLTLRAKLGGTLLCGDVTGNVASDVDRAPFRIVFEIANLGAANSQYATLSWEIGPQITAAPTIGAFSTLTNKYMLGTGTLGAVDTSAAVALAVTAVHSAANANLSLRLRTALVEVI